MHYTPQLAEVRSLAVHVSATGNGLGSAVLRALIALARRQKVPTLFALTRVAPLFVKLDFSPSDKAFFPEKIWRDCQLCPIQEHCDESAVVLQLADSEHSSRQQSYSRRNGYKQKNKEQKGVSHVEQD